MLLLPLPLFIAELLVFIMAVKQWGFFDTIGIYILPSLLGLILLSFTKRVGMAQFQMAMMMGQAPEKAMLHSGAVFLGAVMMVVPMFITRVFAVFLLLPGLRHLVIWKFTSSLKKRMQSGQAGAGFGGPFGFGGGMGEGPGGGFKYYSYRAGSQGEGFQEAEQAPRERVIDAEVIDVDPLEISHTQKGSNSDSKE